VFIPVIIAGGVGSRLWPLSRRFFPKQFMSFGKEFSLFQETFNRLNAIPHMEPFVVCNEEHRFLVKEQLSSINIDNYKILLEPEGRNTAPAVAVAAFNAVSDGADPLLLVLPSDHFIRDIKSFEKCIKAAIPLAEADRIVTFGVNPSRLETGYGYIEIGDEVIAGCYEIASFVEKPNPVLAKQFLEDGRHLWNSGIYLLKASVYLAELKRFRSDIYGVCKEAVEKQIVDGVFVRPEPDVFRSCETESIDYAVMEKTKLGAVTRMDSNWSDLGSFESVYEVAKKNEEGNFIFGDVVTKDSSNSYILSDGKLVAALGIDNLVIINTKDVVLVANKNEVQKIKSIVEDLKNKNRNEIEHHRVVYRPWGSYDSVDNGNRFQVKRITVNPGAKLSLQMHHHRAEHWVVVSGTAKVDINGTEKLLTENESVYIPIGAVHSLENPGKVPLELIEVQVGSYLGEDDIVRIEDKYGRK